MIRATYTKEKVTCVFSGCSAFAEFKENIRNEFLTIRNLQEIFTFSIIKKALPILHKNYAQIQIMYEHMFLPTAE